MNEGMAASSTQPDRPANFFESTETAYNNATDRLNTFANRIDNLSDRVGGHQGEAVKDGSNLSEKPSSFFDRCNLAEKQMLVSLNQLEDSVSRLENIGLF